MCDATVSWLLGVALGIYIWGARVGALAIAVRLREVPQLLYLAAHPPKRRKSGPF